MHATHPDPTMFNEQGITWHGVAFLAKAAAVAGALALLGWLAIDNFPDVGFQTPLDLPALLAPSAQSTTEQRIRAEVASSVGAPPRADDGDLFANEFECVVRMHADPTSC